MKKWNLIIDIEKCTNCNNCFLACKDEFVDNEFPGYSARQPKRDHRWLTIHKRERGQFPFIDVSYLPLLCFHCDEAHCVKRAKDGSVYKRNDGIVIIDPVKAKGQPDIADSCPYGAIRWNEQEQLAQKCTLCAHLLDDGWKQPRCVSVCPTQALRIEHLEDDRMDQMRGEENLEPYKAGNKTGSRVHYKNLHRFTDCFIGGSVSVTRNQVTDCLENAEVNLADPAGNKLATRNTDVFGDFKFDRIKQNSGIYRLTIHHAEFGCKEMNVEVTDNVNIGVIAL